MTASLPAAGGTGIWSDEHIHSLHDIAVACHDRNTKLFVQLAYPSAGHHNGDSVNHLAADELEVITEEFVKAAFRCKEAGCDGVNYMAPMAIFLNMLASSVATRDRISTAVDLEVDCVLQQISLRYSSFADDDFIIAYRMGWNDDPEPIFKPHKPGNARSGSLMCLRVFPQIGLSHPRLRI